VPKKTASRRQNGVDDFLTSAASILITRPTHGVAAYTIARVESDQTKHEKPMTDLIYVGITVLFFVVSGLYVRFCEKL
jgi:hypothetical protein